jgi:hypothetical protein
MNVISKEMVEQLYNPAETGVLVIPEKVSEPDLIELRKFIKEKENLFEIKREKYIANNQRVSLLYRGPFDLSSLDNTVFSKVLENYKQLREECSQYSSIPFEQGTSIEVKLIHYPISELGVGIHKDLSSNINMIVFYNIEGETYSTKTGDDPVKHPVKAGDISIMRGPRSKDEPDIRPYHGVEEVKVSRMVLVIREIDEELEKETNKDNWMGF